MGLDRILGQIAAGGGLRADRDPSRLADLCLTLLVPSAWRYLVVERGWAVESFARSCHALIDALLAEAGPTPNPTPTRRSTRLLRR